MIRILPHLFFLMAVLGMAAGLCAGEPIEVPHKYLAGILAVETRSHYRPDGSIAYVDRRDGRRGEVGAFQLTRKALRDVRLLRDRAEIRKDPGFAEFAAILYLRHWYRRTGSWERAVQCYHTGTIDETADGIDYLSRVRGAVR